MKLANSQSKYALFSSLLVVVVSGCAVQQTWHKPGAGSPEFYTDDGQCKAQAFGVVGMNMTQVALVYNGCMRGKGWYLQ